MGGPGAQQVGTVQGNPRNRFGYCSCRRYIRGRGGGGAPEWPPPPPAGPAFVRAGGGRGRAAAPSRRAGPGPAAGVAAGSGREGGTRGLRARESSAEGGGGGGTGSRLPGSPARSAWRGDFPGASPLVSAAAGRWGRVTAVWPPRRRAVLAACLEALPGREADSLLKQWLLRAMVAISLAFDRSIV